MLVLTRKVNASLFIDTPAGRITVTVLGVEPYRTKLGIVAPDGCLILRAELETKGGTQV